jgi:hypothetical protein
MVDFAGTYAEAVAYAKQNGVNAPKGLACHGNEGLPMLSLPYKNIAERQAAEKKFEALGWDATINHPTGNGYVKAYPWKK